jgi:hypothetical protein
MNSPTTVNNPPGYVYYRPKNVIFKREFAKDEKIAGYRSIKDMRTPIPLWPIYLEISNTIPKWLVVHALAGFTFLKRKKQSPP